MIVHGLVISGGNISRGRSVSRSKVPTTAHNELQNHEKFEQTHGTRLLVEKVAREAGIFVATSDGNSHIPARWPTR